MRKNTWLNALWRSLLYNNGVNLEQKQSLQGRKKNMLTSLKIFKNALMTYKVLKLRVKFESEQTEQLYLVVQNSITKTLLSSGMTQRGKEIQLTVNEKIGQFMVDFYSENEIQNIGSFNFEKEDILNGHDLVENTYYHSRLVKSGVEGCTITIDFIFREGQEAKNLINLVDEEKLKKYAKNFLEETSKDAIGIFIKEKELLKQRLKQEELASKERVKKGAKRESAVQLHNRQQKNKLKQKRSQFKKRTHWTEFQTNQTERDRINEISNKEIPNPDKGEKGIIRKNAHGVRFPDFSPSSNGKSTNKITAFASRKAIKIVCPVKSFQSISEDGEQNNSDQASNKASQNKKISRFKNFENSNKKSKYAQKTSWNQNILKCLRNTRYEDLYLLSTKFQATPQPQVKFEYQQVHKNSITALNSSKHFKENARQIYSLKCFDEPESNRSISSKVDKESVLSNKNDKISKYEIQLQNKCPYNKEYNNDYMLNKIFTRSSSQSPRNSKTPLSTESKSPQIKNNFSRKKTQWEQLTLSLKGTVSKKDQNTNKPIMRRIVSRKKQLSMNVRIEKIVI